MSILNFNERFGRLAGAGALALALLSGCGGGGGDAAPTPVNTAPVVAMSLGGAIDAGGSTADVSASTGSELLLSASGSTDADGDALTYLWSIVEKPPASALSFAGATAVQQTLKPDVAGTYIFQVRVTDKKGAFSEKQVKAQIRNNVAPVSNIVVSATYLAQSTTKPTQFLNVGSSVVLDATGSTDADGDAVTTVWTLIEKPATSAAGLVGNDQSARLVTDVAGVFKVRARGTDPHGAYSDTVYVFDANNNAPHAQTVLINSVSLGASGQSTIEAATGYMVALNAAGSSDPAGGAVSYAWTITSKPAGSVAALSSANGSASQMSPDVLGEYLIKLTVTNGAGAASTHITTISVKNRRPLANISSNATPVALPTGPAIRMPVNTVMTLRGTGSVDADGDTLTYAWSMTSKPAGSVAVLSSGSGSTVQMTPERAGTYVVLLRVTDGAGAYSERSLMIEVGNYAPVAVVNKNRVTILNGATVTASAALSYDEDGDALTYAWTIDAHPLGSSATIAAPSTSALAFTPDMIGTYVLAVTVSDGKSSSIAYVNVKVLATVATNVALDFAPLKSRYSKGLDKMIVVSSNPDALKIIDPFTAAIKTVLLPLGVKSMQLSPDGKLAAVLHESVVSMVNLESAIIVRSSATSGSQTDAFITNAGLIYMIGQTGGQWVDEPVGVIDGHTGANLTATHGLRSASFYGTQLGIYAPLKNKVFFMELGLSPADISFFSINPATGIVSGHGESPYHGDYSMSVPLFLNGSEDLVFTAMGNYFRTDTLRYAGKLTMTGGVLSMSHSSEADEALVLPTGSTYAASYLRFSGALFLPESAVTLPVIASAQSYGIAIFHSANGNHISLVQTGTAVQNGSGARYYVSTR